MGPGRIRSAALWAAGVGCGLLVLKSPPFLGGMNGSMGEQMALVRILIGQFRYDT